MKRFFSLVLALVMVLQLCPLTAMAEIDRSRFRTAESVNDVPTAAFATVVFRYEEVNTPVKKLNIQTGKTVGSEEMPTAEARTGFDFVGWFDGETEITADTPITSSITATAKYTKKAGWYTVTFYNRDADPIESRTLEGGRYSVGRLPRRLVGGHAAEGGAWPPWLFVDAGVMPWNKLFRRSFVQRHAFAFQEVVRHNDMRFVCCALAAAGKIAVSDTCGYVYRRGRRGSVTGNQDVSPSLFADVLSALRTELDRRGLLAKSMRAYCNLALAHCCYHLLGEFEPGRFAELFAALHGHVLAELGLAAADGDVFINRKHDGYRAAILADETPLSLWMLLLRERYADWRELGARADRIATLQARVREAETERGELAGKVAAAERRVDELERQRAEAVRAQAELARTLQAVRASASYRIGRLVTSPFRALRKPGNA